MPAWHCNTRHTVGHICNVMHQIHAKCEWHEWALQYTEKQHTALTKCIKPRFLQKGDQFHLQWNFHLPGSSTPLSTPFNISCKIRSHTILADRSQHPGSARSVVVTLPKISQWRIQHKTDASFYPDLRT